MKLNLAAVDLDEVEVAPQNHRDRKRNGPYGDNHEAYFPDTHVPGMSSRDWWILSLLLRGQSLPQVAALTGISHPQLKSITSREIFREQLRIQAQTMIENITNGNYGVSAIAKANAPDAMRRVVQLFKQKDDPRVSLSAAEKCLNYAGFRHSAFAL